jgi:hypothetical protein
MEDNSDSVNEDSAKPIEHLIITGGGIVGFTEYGILREANKAGFWSRRDIKTIYGTSIGAIIAVFITLGYQDWEILDNYLIKRPWHSVFPIELNTLLLGFQNRGLFGQQHFDEIFVPLFKERGISIDITLQEYYDYTAKVCEQECQNGCGVGSHHGGVGSQGTSIHGVGSHHGGVGSHHGGVEIHIFALDINKDYSVDMEYSYKTHPNMRLLDVVYASSTLPGVFRPILTPDGGCLIDGGVFNNFPLYYCIKNHSPDPATIFAIKRCVKKRIHEIGVTNDSTILDIILTFCSKITERIVEMNYREENELPYLFNMECMPLSLTMLFEVMKSVEDRRKMVENGKEQWDAWIARKS